MEQPDVANQAQSAKEEATPEVQGVECVECQVVRPRKMIVMSLSEAVSYAAQCVAIGAMLPGVLEAVGSFL